MPTRGHIEFVQQNRHLIREPILIVASKIYDYDPERLQDYLKQWGFSNFIGIDLSAGEGVDEVVDVTDSESEFWKRYQNYFETVFTLELWTYVRQPFVAANLISNVIRQNGLLFLSESTTRKKSRMPIDLWRFTLEGLQTLFDGFEFEDARVATFYTRSKDPNPLQPYEYELPEVRSDQRHPDETALGFLLRRFHRKFMANGVFELSRLMPENTICAVGKKK
ncbi:hypothetical protein L0152_02065 [bacterium]|nr:hypothetical protein [bacterium]